MSGFVYMIGSLRSGLTAALGTQTVLTLASIGYATGKFGGTPSKLLESKKPEKVFDAHHYDFVTEFVGSLYGGGVRRKRHSQHSYVQLADTATFEDPEIREAFRSLKYLEPESLFPPCLVDVQPQGESIALSYALEQSYLGGKLELKSLLIVRVQLRQLKEIPESEFVVLSMEEHWNGILFWNSYLFRIVRRINGLVSWHLTSRLLY